ncbi:MAG TPA: sodium:solute symporter family protein [Candidatus Limnocylindrales bacterium]|nr:sodium:solute symporter family protein [Candidatus Limnocylindrales bacterium]
MLSSIVVIVFGLVVLLVSIYGYRFSAKTAEDYLLASRSLGVVVMLFFIMFGVLGPWTLLAYPGGMYLDGPGFSMFGWGLAIGYAAMLIFLGPRLTTAARLNNIISPVEILGERYESKFLRVSMAVMLVIFLIPYIAVQPLLTGLAMHAGLGIPVMVGVLFMVVLMLMIVLVGGMRSVAWVNVFLGLIFLIGLFGSFFWVVRVTLPGGLSEAAVILAQNNPSQLTTLGPMGIYAPAMVIATFIAGFCTISFPHIMLSTMGARNITVFKWLAVLFLIMAGAIYFVLTVFGSLVAPAVFPGLTGSSADAALQVVITRFLPEWMSVFFILAVVAAAISTAAIQLMGAGTLISRDILYVLKQDVTDAQLIRWARWAMVFLVLISIGIVALLQERIAFVIIIASSGLFVWLPALWFGLLWKGATTWGVIAGMVGGFVYLIAGYIHPPLFIIEFPIIALIVCVTLTVVVSFFTEKVSDDTISRFFDEVDEYLDMEAGRKL